MNYKEAIIAALDGKRVEYTISGITTEIRFNKEVLEWRQTSNTCVARDWGAVTTNVWGHRPDDQPWQVILPLVSFITAHQAALEGKTIKHQQYSYKMVNGVLCSVSGGYQLCVPPSITALEWTIE